MKQICHHVFVISKSPIWKQSFLFLTNLAKKLDLLSLVASAKRHFLCRLKITHTKIRFISSPAYNWKPTLIKTKQLLGKSRKQNAICIAEINKSCMKNSKKRMG